MLAVIDGRLLDDVDAVISVFDDGVLRGDGVFEVIRLYGGLPWAVDEHLERLALSGSGLRLKVSAPDFTNDIELLLASIGEVDGFLRLVQTRGGRRISLIEDLGPGVRSIALATIEYQPPALMEGVKSLSYAPNMLAARLALERQADDALFVTPEGLVLEASRASFFYVLGQELFTPPLDHVLDSITRRHLMQATRVCERVTPSEDLDLIAEAFIASTTKEILPVHSIDGRVLNAPGPMTIAAGAAYVEHVGRHLVQPLPASSSQFPTF
jgi:branched-chain amino acid aminotransferase